jgi:hypothetical protein
MNNHVTDYLYKLQNTKEIQLITLNGKLKNMETELVVGLFNDPVQLKMFSEKVVHMFDDEGKLSHAGYMEICT